MANLSVRPQKRRNLVKSDAESPDLYRTNLYDVGTTVGAVDNPAGIGDTYEVIIGDILHKYVSRDGVSWEPLATPKPWPWKPEEAWETVGGMTPTPVDWDNMHTWSATDDSVTWVDTVVDIRDGTPVNLEDFAGIAGLNATITSTASVNHNLKTLVGFSVNFFGNVPTGSMAIEFNQPISLDVFGIKFTNTGVGEYRLTGGGTWGYVGPISDNGAVITGLGTSVLRIDSSGVTPTTDFDGEFQITGQFTKFELVKISGTGDKFNRPVLTARDWSLTGVGVPLPQASYTVQRYIDGSLIAVQDDDRTVYQNDLTGLIPLGDQVVTEVITVSGHGYTMPAWNFLPLGVGGALAQDGVVDTVFYATRIVDTDRLEVVSSGYVDAPGHGLTVGSYYYADPTTPGAITPIKSTVDSKRIALAPSPDTVVLFDQGFVTVPVSPTDYGSQGTLTDGVNVVWDATTTRNGNLSTSEATPTLDNPTGLVSGEVYAVTITSTNATNSTVTFGTNYVDQAGVQIDPITLVTGESRRMTFVSMDGASLVATSGNTSVIVTNNIVANGGWNANTNTPDLTQTANQGDGTNVYTYLITDAGNADIGQGATDYDQNGQITFFDQPGAGAVFRYDRPTLDQGNYVRQLLAAAPLTFDTLAYAENQIYVIENLDAASTSALNKIAAGNMLVDGVLEADGIHDLGPLESTLAFRVGNDIHLRPVGSPAVVIWHADNTGVPVLGAKNIYPLGTALESVPVPTHTLGKRYWIETGDKAAELLNGDSHGYLSDGEIPGTWIREATTETRILDRITINNVRSAGTNASSSVSIQFVDKDGNNYAHSDWVVTGTLTQYAGGTGTVVYDKTPNTGTFGLGRNKDGSLDFEYVGDIPNGLSGVIMSATNGGIDNSSLEVHYRGTNYSDAWPNKAAVSTVLWTTTDASAATPKNALVYPVGNFTALAVNDSGTGADGAVYKLSVVDALQITLPNKADMNAAEGIWRVRISGDWAALAAQATVLSFIDDSANGVEMGTGLPDDGNEWLDLVFDAANDKWIATSGGDVTLTQVVPTYTLHTEVPANIRLYLIDGTGGSAEGLWRKETVGDAPNHIG